MTWDIFCTVIDNFGDIGVTWRLARQLAAEHRVPVRLWVDDLASFQRIRPEIDPGLDVQTVGVDAGGFPLWKRGSEGDSTAHPMTSDPGIPPGPPFAKEGSIPRVEVRRWTDPLPDLETGDVVIEALACDLPDAFIDRMARKQPRPVWLNLEYLTAEPWADGVHGLPSPHPRLPLVKHFFMPGFTPKTGGLPREAWLMKARDAFQADAGAQAAFWRDLDLPPRQPGELRLSLFAYENAAIPSLLSTLARAGRPARLMVPEGKALAPMAAWLGQTSLQAGETHAYRNLATHVLPMLDQDGYDRLLWACDVNFVRGEDSFLRAQFAARPLVWQAYPQEDRAHFAKLDAFLDLYCQNMEDELATTTRRLWHAWNEASGVGALWPAYATRLAELDKHAGLWCARLTEHQDLASKLMVFCEKVREKS